MEQVSAWGAWKAMSKEEKKQYTVADIQALPEGQRAELFDGEMVMMATPAPTHQLILIWLCMDINKKIQSRGGKCRAIPAPLAVFLMNDEKNYVEPDVTVICDRNKLDDTGIQGAPDWAVEIVSPSSVKIDYERKQAAYKKAGVREYWIVDHEKQAVVVYRYEKEEGPVLYHFTDKVPVGIYEDFYIDFAELVEYLDW